MARKKNKGEAAKLEMTPMIDVVFQLLIFFIVTLKQQDILAQLDVFRPAPDKALPKEEFKDMIEITISVDGYWMNGSMIPFGTMQRRITRIAKISKDMPVIIKCTMDSPHKYLIKTLDACAKAKLTKISVFSM
ncbi:MAG: biopolymer transporter ExbD [Kiritimatiellae bacterium]|jgi:biopolymer transport protein ExbD|nr:biopolymer transporter ExbD [Kiritimatiellia bacterium]